MSYVCLIHVHDHIWQSDWPSEIRHAACQMVWNIICQVDPKKGIR